MSATGYDLFVDIRAYRVKLKNITSKLHNTLASIAFIRKAWNDDLIKKIAIVKKNS